MRRTTLANRTVLVTVGLLLAATLAGCSGQGERGSTSSFVAGDGTVSVVPGKDRRAPITLAGTTLEGTRLDLAGYRGKPVVVNVWGSWCPPCRQEAAGLQAAYQQLKPSGVQFVGINFRDSVPAALAFNRAKHITYPSLEDDGGQLLLALRGVVSPNAIPSTLVVDGQGRIAARVSGPADTRTVVGLVQDVLKEAPPREQVP